MRPQHRIGASVHLELQAGLLDKLSTWWFLPAMPPKTVSGIVIALQMSMIITMVPNGSAAVDCRTGITGREDVQHVV